MRRGDKYEAAWQRTVLNWGSIREIAKLEQGTSSRLVAYMRAVINAHRAKDDFGQALRVRVGQNIKAVTWTAARNAFHNITPTEWDLDKEPAKLAGYMRNRLEGRLKENPVVTARALALYDDDLPRRLLPELQRVAERIEREAKGEVPEEENRSTRSIVGPKTCSKSGGTFSLGRKTP